ncbi:hypothetical protein BD311DRAFT_39650 [Dichomitus squalens]|uniref:Secreted protein n=1 Tax=Dichomitus squalens TaxID=114155 RepID=A0A4Q9MEE6_9APHY|nr:hypothetical protein BD311DRAFT_39650 [Dichomitus squalens]
MWGTMVVWVSGSFTLVTLPHGGTKVVNTSDAATRRRRDAGIRLYRLLHSKNRSFLSVTHDLCSLSHTPHVDFAITRMGFTKITMIALFVRLDNLTCRVTRQ